MTILHHKDGNIKEWSDGEASILGDLVVEKNETLIFKNCILRFVPDAGLFCLGKIIAQNCTFIPVDTSQPQWRKIRGTTGWKGIADIGKGRSSFIGCTFIGGRGRPLGEFKDHFISRYFGEIDDLEIVEEWTEEWSQEERSEAYKKTIGGALITLNSLVKGCVFQDCNVQEDGGAIVATFNVQIEECSFKRCRAGTDGGAVILKGYSTIKQCLFESCRAGDEGGAILCDDSVTIKQCLFKMCRARTGGGIATHSPSRVYNCNFIKCLSTLGGGGISGEIIGEQLVFRQCRSRKGGGAELEGGSILEDSIFYKCRAKKEGGGVCSFAISRVEIERCKFVKCNAGETGGGARIRHTTMSRCLFKNNTITAAKLDEMSADHLYASGNSLIDRCTFENKINTFRTVPKYILFESHLMEQKFELSQI
jgi:hypothetical protein